MIFKPMFARQIYKEPPYLGIASLVRDTKTIEALCEKHLNTQIKVTECPDRPATLVFITQCIEVPYISKLKSIKEVEK